MDEPRTRAPRWAGLVGTAASLAGLGVAGYLTYEHFTGSTNLACSDKGVVNCLAVTTSAYSKVAGVPVAVLGLVFFAIMVILQLPPVWRRTNRLVRWCRLGWSVVGVGTVVYLIATELFRIDAICLWCTAVHVLTFVVFISTVLATLRMADMADGAWRTSRATRRSRILCSRPETTVPAPREQRAAPSAAVHQRPRRGQQLARLQPRLEAGEDHGPATVELLVGAFAQLIVDDGQLA